MHLSPSPCLARVKALQAAKVIDRYVAICRCGGAGAGLECVHLHQPALAKQGGAGRVRAAHRRA
ncbi:Lrp/AsnC family transcriptional regulator [Polaromonas sp. P1(28)-13]|nr:Lrp/AsnC family transcriptional regulator [Polaromonas sp. P1(28)-13]